MAVVDDARERQRSRAASPGRIRDLAVALFAEARRRPPKAESLLSREARNQRSLQSRDRRFLFDGLHQLIRYEARLAERLQTSDPLALWLGWLVHDGFSPSLAHDHFLSTHPSSAPPFEEACRIMEKTSLPVYAGLHPEIAAQLMDHYGASVWDWVDASNQRAPITLRTNLRKTTPSGLARRLREEGIETLPGAWCEEALHVQGRHNLMGLRCFREGWFEVQDEGSQLLAKLVPSQGDGLDLCAGAGGKTLALAARVSGSILATDVREAPLKELRKRARRADVQVQTKLLNREGSRPSELTSRRFDWVLVDAPCTGLGVLRRHPAHRWMVNPLRLEELLSTQDGLLDRAASLVAPNGRLVYGTCSALPEENQGRVDAFLTRHEGWVVDPVQAPLACMDGPYFRCDPHVHHTDGFFGAVMRPPRT